MIRFPALPLKLLLSKPKVGFLGVTLYHQVLIYLNYRKEHQNSFFILKLREILSYKKLSVFAQYRSTYGVFLRQKNQYSRYFFVSVFL